MSLSSSQLDAFSEIARTASFSKAAKTLHVTQSALSQRIKNLEEALGTALFVREPSGLRLTPTGEELLQYCKVQQAMETECLARILQPEPRKSDSLVGLVRVGGYSTVMRSLVLPALQPLLVKHSGIRIEMITREMRELPGLLKSGETDFIFLDHALEKEGIESHLWGFEENVLIEGKSHPARGDVFLDHDAEDDTTVRFFEAQSKPRSKSLKNKNQQKTARIFLDEIYSIVDGVALGLGRAVVPLHLIREDPRIRIVPGYQPLRIPVFLNSYRQPFYTRLQKVVRALFDCGNFA